MILSKRFITDMESMEMTRRSPDQMVLVVSWLEEFLASGEKLLAKLKVQGEANRESGTNIINILENGENNVENQTETHTKTMIKFNGDHLKEFDKSMEEIDMLEDKEVGHKTYINEDVNTVQEPLHTTIDSDSEFSLGKHLKTQYDQITLSCSHCSFKTIQPLHLNFHRLSEHKRSCNQCDYTALQVDYLNTHILDKHERFKCDECNYESANIFQLRGHIKSMHEVIKFYCDQCNYECDLISTLKLHKHSTHDGIRFKCDICVYKAKGKNILRMHMKKIHSIDINSWFI